jgi:hypothetical protein
MGHLFTKREIAEKFGVTERTVDAWVERGHLAKPIKLGTTVQARVKWPAEAVAKLNALFGASA